MASSTQDLVPNLQLAKAFGALFIGVILAAVLFGVTNIQAFVYFRTHSGAGMTFHKLAGRLCCFLVIWFWILDALHLALIVYTIYFYLVTNFANIDALTEIVWSSKLQLVVAVLSIFVEHLYFLPINRFAMTYAANLLVSNGRSKVLPITAGTVVVLTSGPVISESSSVLLLLVHHLNIIKVVIWCMYQAVHVITDLIKIEWALYMYLGTVAFVDILIASSLCYLLATSRTDFSRMDLFITKLMSYIINTGCLTSICSMIAIITCAVMPENYIFEALEILLPKLYVNSYIALLNAGYYVWANAGTMCSSEFHMRHDIYPPRLVNDGELQASRRSMFQHSDDVLHITRPIQAIVPQRPNEMTMEMDSLFSVMDQLRGSLSPYLARYVTRTGR
ncbi:hypothetical protein EDB19DRAFT_2043844 [Suillus lakei]|nr:hypothetical protein EDB19DRAFT_2043844 [Suillus lakei]